VTDFNTWAAVRTLRGHLGLAWGKTMAQTLNPNLTDEEWREAIARARAIIVNKQNELTRNLSARPRAGEISPFEVRTPGGYIQQVIVYVRDDATGLVDERHFSYKTDTLRRRLDVNKTVWDVFAKAVEDDPTTYPETIVGVAYVGTYERVPKP